MPKFKWTNEFLDILKQKYPEQGSNIPELFENFTPIAIRTKADRLGIKYKYLKKFNRF